MDASASCSGRKGPGGSGGLILAAAHDIFLNLILRREGGIPAQTAAPPGGMGLPNRGVREAQPQLAGF